jgi:flavin reductase (DIM6/NTAB) family NADH-FMN oxidoreductase RutF
MTMGWHTMMGFEPALIGCFIWDQNYSYNMIRKSKECVINIPEVDMVETVVGIGNTTGAEIDKFEHFGLTAQPAREVSAPLIKECFANFECKLFETRMINQYSFFIFEVVKAHVATEPKYPRTVHYTGDGVFMISGEHKSLRKHFKPQNL